MVRPALSASRSLDIIDLLAAAPDRRLSLSEIARAAGINVASCHAVLGVLVERGYLTRDRQTRTYTLGPVLHAIGQAVPACQPLLRHALAAAQSLSAELQVPVLISAGIGDEIVGIHAISDAHSAHTGLMPGERRPMLPPTGAPFIAWAGDEAIAQWLAKAPNADPEWLSGLRRGAESIRASGFEVLLRSSETPDLASALMEFAAGTESAQPPPRERGSFYRLGPDMTLPEKIEQDETYDVMMIAAPIFDRQGACIYNLCIGPFPGLISGRQVLDHADRLLRACVEVMQADRAR